MLSRAGSSERSNSSKKSQALEEAHINTTHTCQFMNGAIYLYVSVDALFSCAVPHSPSTQLPGPHKKKNMFDA